MQRRWLGSRHLMACAAIAVLACDVAATAPAEDGGPDGDAAVPGGDASGPDARVDECPALPPLPPLPPLSATVYVAPTGRDDAAGTTAAPLASLGAAAARLPNGGSVIVADGVYGRQWLTARGTAATPLVIRAAAGATPVFDGGAITADWSGVITFDAAEHVVLSGLEIRGCAAHECVAVDAPAVHDFTIRDCHVHHLDGGLRVAGSQLRIERNHVHDVALVNADNAAGASGWPFCVGTMPDRDRPDAPTARDVIIRDNRIEDCWGEGIGVWFAADVVVEGNTVVNAWNVGIYLDNSEDVTVRRNFVGIARGLGGGGSAVLLGTEPYVGWGLAPIASRRVAIENNVLVGDGGIGWWRSDDTTAQNTYGEVSISHNTIVATDNAIGFAAVGGAAPAPTGCTARNNLLVEANASDVGDRGAWTLGGNAWVNRPRPAIAGADDVAVTLTVPTIADAAAAQALARDAGTGGPGTGVDRDFACAPRDAAAPRRGAFER